MNPADVPESPAGFARRLVDEVRALVQIDRSREAVYQIMREVDSRMSQGDYAACRTLLDAATRSTDAWDAKTLHALLAITFAGKSHLEPERTAFYVTAARVFSDRFPGPEVHRLIGPLATP